MTYVLLILAGGAGLPAAVFAIARHLVWRHADATAAAIRQRHPQPIPVPVQARPKELTRR